MSFNEHFNWFLATKVSPNRTQAMECSPLRVLFLIEISPSPVHCPFWIRAAALLKLHVVVCNYSAQIRTLFTMRKNSRALALTLATVAGFFTEHFACRIIRIKVISIRRFDIANPATFRRRRVGLSRAISGCYAAKPTVCNAGEHRGRT